MKEAADSAAFGNGELESDRGRSDKDKSRPSFNTIFIGWRWASESEQSKERFEVGYRRASV